MQSLSPTSRYLLALKEGSHQPDDVQQEAVSRLDTIYRELQENAACGRRAAGEIQQAAWQTRTGGGSDRRTRPVYVGGVGRGKTG